MAWQTGRMVRPFSGKGLLKKVQVGHFGQAEFGKSASCILIGG